MALKRCLLLRVMLMLSNAKTWIENHSDQLRAAFLLLAVLVLIIGLCFSWFVYNKSLSTTGLVKEPSDIMLRGPNATEMARIDLTYDPTNDIVTENDGSKTITVKRAFCVKTKDKNVGYNLFLSRTTNISGMEVKLFRATALDNPATVTEADVLGLDGLGRPFAWNKDSEDLISTNQGKYINKLSDAMRADTNHDSQTFEQFTDIQRNASSVYWEKTGLNSGDDSVDNYIIEVTWTETQKETDVLYLIANAGSSQGN